MCTGWGPGAVARAGGADKKKKKEMGPPPGCKVSVEKNLETGREQGQRAEKWRRGSSGGMTKVEPPAE